MLAVTVEKRQPHPPGLFALSAAEAGERFGFYLVLALLIMYFEEGLGMSKPAASAWFGNYTALAYVAAVPGGLLAGRFGQRRWWVLAGAGLLTVGYWTLGRGLPLLYPSVAVLIIGNGLFKPNISAMVGQLYPLGDSRRREGFAIFYFAINFGGTLGPLAGEFARSRWGWSGPFVVATAALLLSKALLLVGWRYLPKDRHAAGPNDPRQDGRSLSRALTVLLICSVALVPFWAVFQQTGTALTFWARDNTVRSLWGREIPPGDYASVNPVMVLALSPLITLAFRYLRRKCPGFTTAWKLIAGVLFAAMGFGLMNAAARLGGDTGRVSQAWLIGCYLCHSVGELFLSPVGLAMVSAIAPPRYAGMLMGAWFGITALGYKLAGIAGSQWDRFLHSTFFGTCGLVLVGSALVLTLFVPWLNRAIPEEVE